jgi:hypothetical protein
MHNSRVRYGLTASVSAVTYRRYRPTEREKSVSPALRLRFFRPGVSADEGRRA